LAQTAFEVIERAQPIEPLLFGTPPANRCEIVDFNRLLQRSC
jgi:hypothetical protein